MSEKEKVNSMSKRGNRESLHYAIAHCRELQALELEGFIRGHHKGKTMNVRDWVLIESLRKQMRDLEKAWPTYYVTVMPNLKEEHRWDVLRALADLRNVAGCCFLKIQEGRGQT